MTTGYTYFSSVEVKDTIKTVLSGVYSTETYLQPFADVISIAGTIVTRERFAGANINIENHNFANYSGKVLIQKIVGRN